MDDKLDHKPPKNRWRRTAKRLFYTVLLLVILLIAAWEITGCRALNKAVERARAVDPRLTIEEIEASRKVWPDDENGALVLAGLLGPLADLGNDASIRSLPMMGCGTDTPELGRRWTTDVDQAVTSQFRKLAAELSVIDRMVDFEGGRFPLPTTYPLMPDLKHMAGLRMAVRIKSLQALQHAMKSDHTATIHDVETIASINRLLADEPMLISALLRIAIDALMVRAIEHCCSLAEFSEHELGQLEQLVEASDGAERLTWGMLGERASVIQMCDKLRKETLGTDWRLPGIRGAVLRDKALGLELLSGWVKASKHPEQALAINRELSRKLDTLPRYAVLTSIWAPSFNRSFVLDMRSVAQLRAARIALAIERYRIDRRLWPGRLDELVPDYIEAIPADPFKDQAMSYLVDDGTVVVYSIGDDETDNGGDVTHHRVTDEKSPTDWGFVLLPPERRNRPALPASMPATQP